MATPDRNSWLSFLKSKAGEYHQLYISGYTLHDLDLTGLATTQVVAGFALGSLTTIGAIALHARYLKRIPTADWVHPRLIAKRKWIKGVVTSVGDGDGFRLYHTPGPFWRWPLRLRRVPLHAKDLKDETIHIRVAGIDAPEAAHFGKPAQPYAAEALSWLKHAVEGRPLWVQLIRRDQYGRIVAIPVHPPRLPLLPTPARRCVSLAMLSAGLARTYEQSGAEYGPWGKDKFLQYEDAARRTKRGMWASDVPLESPAEYKKRYREGNAADPAQTKESGNTGGTTRSWIKFLFGRR